MGPKQSRVFLSDRGKGARTVNVPCTRRRKQNLTRQWASNFNIQCTEATAQCKPRDDIHPIARPTAGTSCGSTAARTTQATENAYWMHKGRQYSIDSSVE